jgi:hypothetical protein
MSDLFIWIYSGGWGREIHEHFKGKTSYKNSGTCELDTILTELPQLLRFVWGQQNTEGSLGEETS